MIDLGIEEFDSRSTGEVLRRFGREIVRVRFFLLYIYVAKILLFLSRRLYDLCRSHMAKTSVEADEEAFKDEDSDDFVRSLEVALCDQLHGGIDIACEAVFNMKVLLALEHRLYSLTS